MTLQAFTELSLDFQQKIIDRSGLGDETYLPDGGPRASPASPFASSAFTMARMLHLLVQWSALTRAAGLGRVQKLLSSNPLDRAFAKAVLFLGETRSCENIRLCAARDRGVVPRWLRCGWPGGGAVNHFAPTFCGKGARNFSGSLGEEEVILVERCLCAESSAL